MLSDGRNAHLIQESPGWWLGRLEPYFDVLHVQQVYKGFFVIGCPKGLYRSLGASAERLDPVLEMDDVAEMMRIVEQVRLEEDRDDILVLMMAERARGVDQVTTVRDKHILSVGGDGTTFEVLNGAMASFHNKMVQQLVEHVKSEHGKHISMVGGSDAHTLKHVAKVHTVSRGENAQTLASVTASLPLTGTPRASMIRAMPESPAPPMPTKCTRPSWSAGRSTSGTGTFIGPPPGSSGRASRRRRAGSGPRQPRTSPPAVPGP